MARRELVEASAELAERAPAFAKIVEAAGPCDLRSGRPRRTHFAELARADLLPAARRYAAARDPRAVRGLVRRRADAREGARDSGRIAAVRGPLGGEDRVDPRSGRARARGDGRCSIASVGAPTTRSCGELTQVRGIGRWTAEMFLMFQLGRLDVWPVDDLGVRKGYAALYALPDAPAREQLDPLGEVFRPYRSVAAWYCWRAIDDRVRLNG